MLENNYSLVPIRPQDWEPIRQWRNEQMDVLRQDYIITEEEQKEYAARYYLKYRFIFDKLLFSFLLNDKLIGYGGFSKINLINGWAETSFLLDGDFDYKGKLLTFLRLLESHTKRLDLHRWHSETFAFRTHHIQCLEEYGFKKEGILIDHIRKNGKYIDVVVHGKILR